MSDPEAGYTEWRCTACGHGVPRKNPPCSRCGNMDFERVEVRASDFDAEARGPRTRDLLREYAPTLGAAVAILLVGLVVFAASLGVVVVSDPFGLGYRFGAVDPVAPDGTAPLTAAEFHGRVAAAYDDTSLRWRGRDLRLSYASRASTGAALREEVMQIATWYADYVGDGGTARSLRITAVVGNDARVRVTVDSGDAAAFAAGDISAADYRSRVLDGG